MARDMWPGTWHSDAAEMLRNDLKDAQIPYEDERGRIFDFHALRHQFISNLASAGVHPKVAQQLARHSSISLTMDRYTHLQSDDVANALHELPELPSNQHRPGKPESQEGAWEVQMVAPLVAPTDVVSWQLMIHPGTNPVALQTATSKQNPLPDKGFDAVCHPLTTDDISEADGTRTRNHRIDSPRQQLARRRNHHHNLLMIEKIRQKRQSPA